MKPIALAGFVALLTGPVALGLQGSGADCNSNGILDVDEIASGRAFDTNGNSIPDACESSRPWPVIRGVSVNRGPNCGWWTTGSLSGVWDLWMSRSSQTGPWVNGGAAPGSTIALEIQLQPGVNTLFFRHSSNGCGSPVWGAGLWASTAPQPDLSVAPGNPSIGYTGFLNTPTNVGITATGTVNTQLNGWAVRVLSYTATTASDLVGPESLSLDGSPDIVTALTLHASPCGLRLRQSPELAPFSLSEPRTWTVSELDTGITDAVISITARGSLGTATRFLNIRLDGMLLGTVFGAGSGASPCSTNPNLATLAIPSSLLAAAISDGQLEFAVEPSVNATSAGCTDATLSLNLSYRRSMVDCDSSGGDDECELATGDCNQNWTLDACEIASGSTADVNGNGLPDECESDCNENQLPDAYEVAQGLVQDCNQNLTPDSCDVAVGGGSADVDANGVPDECKADCNDNDLPDAYEIAQGLLSDCNNNAVPDSCQIAGNSQLDCNTDGILDSCQGGPDGSDCDNNGTADVCDILGGAADENANGRLDLCELRYGDLNLDGQINGTDLAGLLAVWGLPNPPYGDLNGDDQVGGSDLAFLLARWGPVP